MLSTKHTVCMLDYCMSETFMSLVPCITYPLHIAFKEINLQFKTYVYHTIFQAEVPKQTQERGSQPGQDSHRIYCCYNYKK